MQFMKPLKLYDLAFILKKRLIGVDAGSSCTGLCVVDVFTGSCFPLMKDKVEHICPGFEEFLVLQPSDMSTSTMTDILNRIATDWDAIGCVIGYNYRGSPAGDYRNNGAKFTRKLVRDLHDYGGLLPGLFTFVNEYGSTKAGEKTCKQSHPTLFDDAQMFSLYPHITSDYLAFLRKSYCDGFAALHFSQDFLLNARARILYKSEFDRKMQAHLEAVANRQLGFELEGDSSYMVNGAVFLGSQKGV